MSFRFNCERIIFIIFNICSNFVSIEFFCKFERCEILLVFDFSFTFITVEKNFDNVQMVVLHGIVKRCVFARVQTVHVAKIGNQQFGNFLKVIFSSQV